MSIRYWALISGLVGGSLGMLFAMLLSGRVLPPNLINNGINVIAIVWFASLVVIVLDRWKVFNA